jgi:hypothetical protein
MKPERLEILQVVAKTSTSGVRCLISREILRFLDEKASKDEVDAY